MDQQVVSRRTLRLGGRSPAIASLHSQRHHIPVRRSTHSRSRNRNLRCPQCRRRRHSYKSRSRRGCRRGRDRHRPRARHKCRSRVQPRSIHRAIRTPARDRPRHALIGRKLLLTNSHRPRVTRFIRKQSRQSRTHRHQRSSTAAAPDPAARNQRHQPQPQTNDRNPDAETRLAASPSPDSHHSHQHRPRECEE